MPEQAFLEALGVTVVEVAGLQVDACYVDDIHVGLVRAGLTPPALAEAYDWFLTAVSDDLFA